jgi:hypothetical protein
VEDFEDVAVECDPTQDIELREGPGGEVVRVNPDPA